MRTAQARTHTVSSAWVKASVAQRGTQRYFRGTQRYFRGTERYFRGTLRYFRGTPKVLWTVPCGSTVTVNGTSVVFFLTRTVGII